MNGLSIETSRMALPDAFRALLADARRSGEPYGLWCGPRWIAWTSPPDKRPPNMAGEALRIA